MNQAASSADAIADLGGETMGTSWRVRLVVPRARALHPLHEGIQAGLDRVVAQMSTWEPDSAISRYNRAAAGTWHPLPDGFATVLQAALEVAEASGGAFDPSLGALVELWGFGAGGGERRVPAPPELHAARARCGWERIVFDRPGRGLLQPGGMQLDLSAIAKGYAVDAAAAWLRAAGVRAALVEVGGELYGYGRRPDGARWQVLAEMLPDDCAEPPCILALEDLAVATSGDRWHAFEQDGRRYGHTIAPASGAPVTDAPLAVTVLAADAMRADAWATALTACGAAAGMALATRLGLAARFALRGAEAPRYRDTPRFAALNGAPDA